MWLLNEYFSEEIKKANKKIKSHILGLLYIFHDVVWKWRMGIRGRVARVEQERGKEGEKGVDLKK